MLLQSHLPRTVLMACASLMLGGCMSLSGYHSARSLGKGNWEMIGNGNIFSSPYFIGENQPFSNRTQDTAYVSWVNLELQFQGGVSEKSNLGLRVNSEFMIGIMTKRQIIGDRESEWAMAVGAEYGVMLPVRHYLQLPLFFSFHPHERGYVYLNPKYIREGRFQKFGSSPSINYLGFNSGIAVGRDVKFVFDAGLFRSIRYDTAELQDFYMNRNTKVLVTMGMGLVIKL